MSLTCYAISSEWELKNMILRTQELPVDHTAENLSDALSEVMIEWAISEKVVGITTDNAKNIANEGKTLHMFNMPSTGHTLQLSVLVFHAGFGFKDAWQVANDCRHFHR